jgi:hypothetical protein
VNREAQNEKKSKYRPSGTDANQSESNKFMSGLMNGQEPRKNVNFFGPDHGDSSDSDENRHHTQNAKSHFDLRGDASVNNDGLHGISLEDQFMRQEHQATAIQMQ